MRQGENMLKKLLQSKKVKVGIVGLGYVGLPIAVEIAHKGVCVIGLDIDKNRVHDINKGISLISDVASSELKPLVKQKQLVATADIKQLKPCDIILICVPTPVNVNKEPDLEPVITSTRAIKKILRKGQLVILKSTTYPETTEKVILPILSETGLVVGRDFFLAFCPERIDPGNKRYGVLNTPTVIGGITKTCTELAAQFYKNFVSPVCPVSSAKVAEMTKLLENTFRNVNIALVNEFAQLCERMGDINIWEVIEAAQSKPFGFMPFYPGPGVGGHCIPIDPYYLSWKAREYDFHTVFIELSARINEEMPYFTVNKTINELSLAGICPAKAQVLLLGMAFKKDIGDVRASPALKVYQIIESKVKRIRYNDPHVPSIKINGRTVRSVKISARELKKYDAVIILTDHSAYDYDLIVKNSRIIVDTRNAIKKKLRNVKKLGA
jgi:UDP-N-acetyl-D-glucosamine dehydrogenase